jgi:hypothetical protein
MYAKVDIGIGQLRDVAALRSLRPIEHAAGDVRGIASPCELATMLLRSETEFAAAAAVVDGAESLSVTDRVARLERRLLLRGERDIAHPQADRTHGDPDDLRDLLHRESLFAAQSASLFALLGLHEHMFATMSDGTAKSNPDRYPQRGSNSLLRLERAPCSPLHHGGARGPF